VKGKANMEESLFNEFLYVLGAFFIALSLLMREISHLRIFYLISSVIYFVYGFLVDDTPIMFTSTIFFAINVFGIVKFPSAFRKVKLSDKLAKVHEIYKHYISTGEFKELIDQAKRKVHFKDVLVEHGQNVTELLLILDGTVDIVNDGKVINTLGPGNFIGEFGILTGKKASASVHCNSLVEVSIWKESMISRESKLRQLISINLVNKLINVNRHKDSESTPTDSL
jgi:Cyclic nucleotide-binding domain